MQIIFPLEVLMSVTIVRHILFLIFTLSFIWVSLEPQNFGSCFYFRLEVKAERKSGFYLNIQPGPSARSKSFYFLVTK
jgi:hypothetical protein